MNRKLFAAPLCALILTFLSFGVPSARAQDVRIDPAFQALSAGNVYVDPRIQGVETQRLEQAAMQSQDNPHTRIKIALLARLPADAGNRNVYAGKLHRDLGLDKEGLVLVALSGQGAGVTVVANGLSRDETTRLAKQYGSAILTNPADGTAALAQAVASDINGKEYRSTAWLWGVFFLVVAVIGGLLVSASRRKKAELTTARGPIQALRENVLSGIEYIDGYMDVLPKNNPDSDQVRIFRQSASAKYDQAVKIMDRATEMTDLNRAQNLLDQAQADVQQSRRSLDRATGGAGSIPGDDALRPQPLPESQSEVSAIPEGQRGVSFFSGRPAPLSSLVPVTLTVQGQSRQVLVTPQEADELRQGRMPQVLAFQDNGRETPWYEYNQYDPYRDYWRYENAGWGGLGNGLVAGFIGAELLGGLMTPAYAMPGYSPYAFATDTPAYQGYNGGADNEYGGFGGADGDGQGYDNAGGSDFLTTGDASFEGDDAGGMDFGGSDAGGGMDFGSGDFGGGSDFGGGDFGGGDFGGGGDSS